MMGHGHNIVEQIRSELILKLQDNGSLYDLKLRKLVGFGQILNCNTSATSFKGRVLVAYSEMIDILKIGFGR